MASLIRIAPGIKVGRKHNKNIILLKAKTAPSYDPGLLEPSPARQLMELAESPADGAAYCMLEPGGQTFLATNPKLKDGYIPIMTHPAIPANIIEYIAPRMLINRMLEPKTDSSTSFVFINKNILSYGHSKNFQSGIHQ